MARKKTHKIAPLSEEKGKIIFKVAEPKVRFSKELCQAGFSRKAGRMGKRKGEKLRKIIERELKRLSD
ncbi:MAG: hypothetical protein Q8M83_02295 [bacterium]|nr:hypothetical protein [bacterium]